MYTIKFVNTYNFSTFMKHDVDSLYLLAGASFTRKELLVEDIVFFPVFIDVIPLF